MKTLILSFIFAAAACAQGLTICQATDATGTAVKLNAASKPICFTITPAAVQALTSYRAAALVNGTPKYLNNWQVIKGNIEELLNRVVDLYPPAVIVTQKTAVVTAQSTADAAVKTAAATTSTEQ